MTLQQKVRTNMSILAFIFSIFLAALGIFLLVMGRDDALANIPGMVLAILGCVRAGVYSAMLMGW